MASDESSAAALTEEAPDLANGSSESSATKASAEEVVGKVDDLTLDEPQEAEKKKKKNKSKKKKEPPQQTDPPSLPVVELFPSGEFPEGEIQQYKDEANTPCFSDVVLVACGSPDSSDMPCNSPSIPVHRALLTSRSSVFRAMLENEMEEGLSRTIKMNDVSYDALRAFVNYLYTAEACLDEHMACDLLVLAEKYQVKHLKTYCEKYLMSRLNWENSLPYYAFAHQHGAKTLLDAALSLILDHMDKVTKREYAELVDKDPRVVVDIYEAYLSKQVNTAATKDSTSKAPSLDWIGS